MNVYEGNALRPGGHSRTNIPGERICQHKEQLIWWSVRNDNRFEICWAIGGENGVLVRSSLAIVALKM